MSLEKIGGKITLQNKSILDTIKGLLDIADGYGAFDEDIIIHINTAFMTLNQLGVGPEETFYISSKDNTWQEFMQDDITLEGVKTYIYMKVRLVFDPPTSSFVIDAFNKNIAELEFRLKTQAETNKKEVQPDE